MQHPVLRTLAVPALLAAAALAACGDDGVSGDRLTLDEVAGVYNVCEFVFQPSNTALAPAPVLGEVMDTTTAAADRPTLRVSGSAPEFQLVYTRASDRFLQIVRGDLRLRRASVVLELPEATSAVAREALLPAEAELDFAPATGVLSSDATASYTVRREDYVRVSGADPTDLNTTITGTLRARFSTGACS